MKEVAIKFYGRQDEHAWWISMQATDAVADKFVRFVASAKTGNNNALVELLNTEGEQHYFSAVDIEKVILKPIKWY